MRKPIPHYLVALLVTLSLLVAGVSCQGAAPEAPKEVPKETPKKTYTLNVASAYGKDSIYNEALFHLIDTVNANCKTDDGNIEMNWVGGPETFKATDLPDVTKAGSVDYFYGFPGYYVGMVPEYNLVGIPYAWNFDNAEAIWNEGIGTMMDEASQRAGLKMVRFSAVIPFYFFMTKPFDKLADFQGKKLRVPGGLFSYLPAHMGATSVKLASAEVYMGMKTGTIDGGLQPLGSYTDYSYWEVAPYVFDYPVLVGGSGCEWMSLKKFNSLPVSLQTKLLEIASDDIGWSVDWWERKAGEWIGIMKEHGSQFVSLSAEDKAEMQSIILKLKDKVAEDLPEKSAQAFKIYDKYAK